MTRLGAHSFLWSADVTPDTVGWLAGQAAAAGLDFVEMPLLDPDNMDPAALKAGLGEPAVGVTCSLGLPAHAYAPENPEAAVAVLERALAIADRLGASALTGVIYGCIGRVSGQPPTAAEWDTIAGVLERVAATARARGLRLGVEPVNRYESHLVNTAAQGRALLDRIGADNTFLHLDTYHMNIEEEGFLPPIEASAASLGYLHLSESQRGVPGRGNVAWDDVFRALAASGFDGDLALEAFAHADAKIAAGLSLWRNPVPSVEAVTGGGLSFLRDLGRRHGVV